MPRPPNLPCLTKFQHRLLGPAPRFFLVPVASPSPHGQTPPFITVSMYASTTKALCMVSVAIHVSCCPLACLSCSLDQCSEAKCVTLSLSLGICSLKNLRVPWQELPREDSMVSHRPCTVTVPVLLSASLHQGLLGQKQQLGLISFLSEPSRNREMI